MLENGDSLDVDCNIGPMNFNTHGMSTLNLDAFYALDNFQKPYVINLNRVECIVGEWNKDKTEYGLRICFASGNTVWIGKDASGKLFNYFKQVGKGEDFLSKAGISMASSVFRVVRDGL